MRTNQPAPEISGHEYWHVGGIELIEEEDGGVVRHADCRAVLRQLAVRHAYGLDLVDVLLPGGNPGERGRAGLREVALEEDGLQLDEMQGVPAVGVQEALQHALGQRSARSEATHQDGCVAKRKMHCLRVQAHRPQDGDTNSKLPLHRPGREDAHGDHGVPLAPEDAAEVLAPGLAVLLAHRPHHGQPRVHQQRLAQRLEEAAPEERLAAQDRVRPLQLRSQRAREGLGDGLQRVARLVVAVQEPLDRDRRRLVGAQAVIPANLR
mmetsp:Transcript_71998/g.210913  ORF Transcript_71998/g.210913 Transcript_71998/m.210913 type:complete len:265 (-) Transcript_71998:63-857(-)